MDPKLELEQLATERETLLTKANDNTLTEADVDRASEVAKRIDELNAIVAKRDKATQALKGALATGGKAPVANTAKEVGDAGRDTDNAAPTSYGRAYVKSDEMRAHREAHPLGVSGKPVSIKSVELGGFVEKAEGDPSPITTALPGAIQYQRQPGILDLTYPKPLTLLDIITRGTTESAYVEYRQLVARTNNAATVAEGGLKPLSQLTTAVAQAAAHVIADGFKVTNQELQDDGIIASLIDSTLTRNVWEKIEDKVLNGSGNNDLRGILNTTGVLQQAFATDAVTTIRKAMTALRKTSSASVQGVLMNPDDDEALDLLQDDMGRYYGNGPFGSGPNTIWGRPRIVSEKIPVGTAVAGEFTTINLLERSGLSIEAFNQNEDDARHNLTYIRAEVREMLIIREPAKLAVIDLTV